MASVTPAVTEFAREAQDLLRDASQFKWYVVTLLVLVIYIYAVEVERRLRAGTSSSPAWPSGWPTG